MATESLEQIQARAAALFMKQAKAQEQTEAPAEEKKPVAEKPLASKETVAALETALASAGKEPSPAADEVAATTEWEKPVPLKGKEDAEKPSSVEMEMLAQLKKMNDERLELAKLVGGKDKSTAPTEGDDTTDAEIIAGFDEEDSKAIQSYTKKQVQKAIADLQKANSFTKEDMSRFLQEYETKSNRERVSAHLDEKYPEAAKYLGSQQYADFNNEDIGLASGLQSGRTYGEVLAQAVNSGDRKTAGKVLEIFLKRMAPKKASAYAEPASGGGFGGKVKESSGEKTEAPSGGLEIAKLQQVYREATRALRQGKITQSDSRELFKRSA